MVEHQLVTKDLRLEKDCHLFYHKKYNTNEHLQGIDNGSCDQPSFCAKYVHDSVVTIHVSFIYISELSLLNMACLYY